VLIGHSMYVPLIPHPHPPLISSFSSSSTCLSAQLLTHPAYTRGAKVAMTLALRSPAKISALIPVDNAPMDAVLKSDFAKYTYGMRKIVEKGVTNAKEADEILKEYEDVHLPPPALPPKLKAPLTPLPPLTVAPYPPIPPHKPRPPAPHPLHPRTPRHLPHPAPHAHSLPPIHGRLPFPRTGRSAL